MDSLVNRCCKINRHSIRTKIYVIKSPNNGIDLELLSKSFPLLGFVNGSLGHRLGEGYDRFFFLGALSRGHFLYSGRRPYSCCSAAFSLWEGKVGFINPFFSSLF